MDIKSKEFLTLERKIVKLEAHVAKLIETVTVLKRDNNRHKSDINQISQAVNRMNK